MFVDITGKNVLTSCIESVYNIVLISWIYYLFIHTVLSHSSCMNSENKEILTSCNQYVFLIVLFYTLQAPSVLHCKAQFGLCHH